LDIINNCVIGAGVVGLAVARSLAKRDGNLVILDKEAHFGQGISSRNSEVIHAGIYYDAGSLKAELCVEGKTRLYEYCESHKVSHQRIGKLIVATSLDEASVLDGIKAKAQANGVFDLTFWDAMQIKAEEPAVKAVQALFSPSTGIVSAHDLMTAYLGDIESCGGSFVGNTKVIRIEQGGEGFIVTSEIEGEVYQFTCQKLVNAAGLGAQEVHSTIEFDYASDVPPLYFCKGSYFTLPGRSPFNKLIYPVPEKSGAGLGVHATIDLGGQVKFGPNVEYIENENYEVETEMAHAYHAAVSRYYPGLKHNALVPAYAGIRPKLQGPGDPVMDFVIQRPVDHGIEGLVQLFGIESPGLTSSLAIADRVDQALLS
jgi:L-2-hydroxyglutarate oxidase LhgO